MRRCPGGDLDGDTIGRNRFEYLFVEHERDNLDNQHEHGRDLFGDGNGYEGMHGLRYGHAHGKSKPDGFSE